MTPIESLAFMFKSHSKYDNNLKDKDSWTTTPPNTFLETENKKYYMENKQPKSLYERILEIINDPMDVLKIKTNNTAKAIEQLVLQEKIDLLEAMINEMIEKGYDDKIVSTRIPQNKLKELKTNQPCNQKTK